MYVCHVCLWPHRPEEAVSYRGTGVTMEVLGIKPGPLEEQQLVLHFSNPNTQIYSGFDSTNERIEIL